MPRKTGAADKTAPSDNEIRTRLFQAAASTDGSPDPFARITVADMAERIGQPESTILYQTDPEAGIDPSTAFRRLAYLRMIERFDTTISQAVHDTVNQTLLKGHSLAQVVASFGQALAAQFLQDPSAAYLLAAATRTTDDPALAAAVTETWDTFSCNAAHIVRLITSARGNHLAMDLDHLKELLQVAVSSGWTLTELVVIIDDSIVEFEGAEFEQTGLVLWSGIRHHLQLEALR